jgi:hypothetical protein
MKHPVVLIAIITGAAWLLWPATSEHGTLGAQGGQPAGRSIGKVSTNGDLIVFELDEGALGRTNLFDLEKRTLRFTPGAGGYRAENVPLQWDAEFGRELSGPDVQLHGVTVPFSGRTWNTLSVGTTGSIAFGPRTGVGADASAGVGRGGGVAIGRFDQLQNAARTLVNAQPAICVFMKPRMSGTRYVKELGDRVVITWSLTEPAGGIQDFTWTPTTNRFQAVLYQDGRIEMSYDQLAARDAIIGIYPRVDAGVETPIAAFKDTGNAAMPAHLDVTQVRVTALDALFLKVAIETRGPVLPEGDPGVDGVIYRMAFVKGTSTASAPGFEWTIRGVSGGGRSGRGAPRYVTAGAGVLPDVKVSGNRLSVQGLLPPGFRIGDALSLSVGSASGAPGGTVDTPRAHAFKLTRLQSPEVDLSSVGRQDGPFPVVFESFHYLKLPNMRDLTCTVLAALGDRFDFLAYYSDFRVDNQEAGTPSNGPLGTSDGGAVTGIGATQRGLDSFCSAGRFQWQFIQPVFVGSNQMHERPPDGVTDPNPRNITGYRRAIGERTPDGRLLPYNYGLSQIAHEMGHRWSAFVSAKVGAETIPLGPTHWARGLHAPVAFPFQRPTEASAMGGGAWQDNFDGTFTQLDDDYYVPAAGWSYLDLYLMGLISASEVPDFFILRNLTPAGRDSSGHPTFKADRTKITIQNVIAVEGPRLPDVDHAQKQFNTGMVVMVEHGRTPSRELIERANGIRAAWIDYWTTTTGHRSSMTATVPR